MCYLAGICISHRGNHATRAYQYIFILVDIWSNNMKQWGYIMLEGFNADASLHKRYSYVLGV
jgi:hypothetical protein